MKEAEVWSKSGNIKIVFSVLFLNENSKTEVKLCVGKETFVMQIFSPVCFAVRLCPLIDHYIINWIYSKKKKYKVNVN